MSTQNKYIESKYVDLPTNMRKEDFYYYHLDK